MEKLTRRELFKSGMGLLTPRKEENLEDRVARLEFNQMLINQFTFYLDMGMTDHEARIKALEDLKRITPGQNRLNRKDV